MASCLFRHHHDDYDKIVKPNYQSTKMRRIDEWLSEEQMNLAKGITSLVVAVFSGWVGVFPLMVTTWRIVSDILYSGELRAVPHAAFNGLYGFSWRIAFFIGSLPKGILQTCTWRF
jgi:hypothetical protein